MRQLICGVAIGIGSGLLIAAAVILAGDKRDVHRARSNRRRTISRSRATAARSPVRRDYFRIRHTGSCWLLRGHGRFECTLEFATWEQAINQARFRLETLGRYERDLSYNSSLGVSEQAAFPELLS